MDNDWKPLWIVRAKLIGIFAGLKVRDALAGRDRESLGNRNAEICHLGEIRAFASEDVRHVSRPLGHSVAEEENRLRHCR